MALIFPSFVSVIVVSIKEKAAQNRSALLTAADLMAWEAKNGRIPDKSVILMTSGWGKYWGNKTAFLGGEYLANISQLV